MTTFIIGIRVDGSRLTYCVEAESEESAFAKIEDKFNIRRDPYGRNWVQTVLEDAEFIISYPIPNPYVG